MKRRTASVFASLGLLAACGSQESSVETKDTGRTPDASAADAAQVDKDSKSESAAVSREVGVTNDDTRSWGELQIAINPKNPDNIVYATVGLSYTRECLKSNDPSCELVDAQISGMAGFAIPQPKGFFTTPDFSVVSAFYSFDRGKTWERTDMPEHPAGNTQGDPSVAVDPDGNFYISWDAMNWGSPENALASAGVGVSKSTDGGKTWSKPVLSGTPVDGPKVVADSVTGTVYVASSGALGPKASGDPSTPQGDVTTRWVAASDDGVSFEPPQAMGGQGGSMSAAHGMLATAFVASAQPSLFSGPNGELCGSEPAPCTIFQTTKDKGATWSRHVMPASSAGGGLGGWPMVAADPAEEGHFAVGFLRGGEYAIYQTHNSGKTWDDPVMVSEDANKSHFHGDMSFATRGGALAMVWRTWEMPGLIMMTGLPGLNAVNAPYSAWVAVSQDGGTTFSRPVKVSHEDSPAPDNSNRFSASGDDYSGVASDGEYIYAGWADWRDKERSNYFAAMRLDAFNQVEK